MPFPRFLLARQRFPDRSIPDVAAETRRQLVTSSIASSLSAGSRVAIGVSSRGIRNIDTVVREVVRYWKERDMRPHIFLAMGSHGAATAEGQAEILAKF